MRVKVMPRKLGGEIAAISSKSYAQRILLVSALADAPTNIAINHFSQDIKSCIGAITAMGASVEYTAEGVVVKPSTPVGKPSINCGESGTTARLILPMATAICKDGGVLVGEGSLPSRPFAELCKSLEQNGVEFDQYNLPITFGGAIKAGEFPIAGDQSSQYISGLMLALPLLDGDSKIKLTSPVQSSGYLDMTLEVIEQFGVKSGYDVKGNQRYISPEHIAVEGDWSNASYWLAVGIMPTGLNINSLQKDSLFPKVCDSDRIDAMDIPDLVPALAIYAAQKSTDTEIYNIQRLRIKESDRVVTVSEMIEALGGKITVEENRMIIHGTGGLRGGEVNSYNDHRIVMSAAVAASFCSQPVIINDAGAVKKSYPSFFEDLQKLGGEYYVL